MFGPEYEYIKEYKPFEIQSQIKEKSIKDEYLNNNIKILKFKIIINKYISFNS